jgi:hypothetical protein
MAGFCNSAGGLQTPDYRSCRPKMPKVSSHSLNNSRFPETPAGDRFDLHWTAELAVKVAKCSAFAGAVIGLAVNFQEVVHSA